MSAFEGIGAQKLPVLLFLVDPFEEADFLFLLLKAALRVVLWPDCHMRSRAQKLLGSLAQPVDRMLRSSHDL
jgi:hypothetical protein